MRKLGLVTLLAIAVTLPLQARTRNESYISYDDGGTIVRSAEDGREMEGRVNLPIFPGDEVITNRRGRAEVRLADGNILAIDRATSVRFHSVLNSYDTADQDAGATVVELKYGKASVSRAGDATESFRLDTANASYFAGDEAAFSVDTDGSGRDHVAVLAGNIEVRTPDRNVRLQNGQAANVDDRGVYDLASDARTSADDFERWFLARTEHYSDADSRYLDPELAYAGEDLSQHGSWTFIGGYGWGWRPYVNTGWRPYFYGQWVHGHNGCLTWVSYEPWGWVPYHYGRWAFDPLYGWFWMPGEAYSPAWVYWWYSPNYIGWAPAGWYDCYRPYYDWAYRPYRGGYDRGFGFYGRVHVNEVDLRPWTFIDAHTILSTRADRAAVSIDVVKQRLMRDAGGIATISGHPARFTHRDWQDPAGAVDAIYRKSVGTGGGGSVAPVPDMTPYFRRDPELPVAIKDSLVRNRPIYDVQPRPNPAAGLTPSNGLTSVAPIGGGSVAPIGGGSLAPISPSEGSVIRRGDPNPGNTPQPPADGGGHHGHNIDRGGTPRAIPATPVTTEPKPEGSWRSRAVRPEPAGGAETTPATATPATPRSNWRSGGTQPPVTTTPQPETPPPPRAAEPRQRSIERGSDVPRRVIDGIGGARLAPAPAHETPPPKSEHHDGGGSKRESGGSSPKSSDSGHSDHSKKN